MSAATKIIDLPREASKPQGGTRLSLGGALNRMRQGQLLHRECTASGVTYALIGGPRSSRLKAGLARQLIRHPQVVPSGDGLFPDHPDSSQTFFFQEDFDADRTTPGFPAPAGRRYYRARRRALR